MNAQLTETVTRARLNAEWAEACARDAAGLAHDCLELAAGYDTAKRIAADIKAGGARAEQAEADLKSHWEACPPLAEALTARDAGRDAWHEANARAADASRAAREGDAEGTETAGRAAGRAAQHAYACAQSAMLAYGQAS